MVPDSMPAVNPRLMNKVLESRGRAGGVQVTECAKDMEVL